MREIEGEATGSVSTSVSAGNTGPSPPVVRNRKKQRKKKGDSPPNDSTQWGRELTDSFRNVQLNLNAAKLTIPLWLVAPLVAFLVFSNGLYGGLVFDDTEVVGKNPDVRAARPYADLWWNDYWGNPINQEGVWTCKVKTSCWPLHALSPHALSPILHTLK